MPKRKRATLNLKEKISKQRKPYLTFIAGLAIIIVFVALGVIFANSRKNIIRTSSIFTENLTEVEQDKDSAQQSFYVVKSGDSLWSISENIYKSGYNWVDIAKANKLENPGLIFAGTKLEIPKIQPKATEANVGKAFEQSTNSSITGSSYAVVKGDNLWEIAVRAYGDGYRWMDIAKTNNLVNPSLIHPGNIFKIPR